MTKGVFIDYTGTMVREDGEYTKRLVKEFITSSSLTDPAKATAEVWKLFKFYEANSYLDNFMTEDEIVDRIIAECRLKFDLKTDGDKLHRLWQLSWVHAPLFDDVKPFFETCPLPIYVITNDGISYIEESMRLKGLTPTGIISAESVRACKPHREIFDKALRVSGLAARDVIHIGDSVVSDVKGAMSAGIAPVLLDRKGTQDCSDAVIIRSLTILNSMLKQRQTARSITACS